MVAPVVPAINDHEIEAILALTPTQRQTVLFSATLPPRIASIAKRHLNDPVRVQIDSSLEATGTGSSRRRAEQQAAENLLEQLEERWRK